MPENESKTKIEKFEQGSKDLAARNAKIRDFFKNLRANVSSKTKGAATEILAYLKALETVAINSPAVGAEMVKRGLDNVKAGVDARVDRFAKEAEKNDRKVDKAAAKRKKETAKKEAKESKHTKFASKAKKLDDKLTDSLTKTEKTLLKGPRGMAKALAAIGFEKTAKSLYDKATSLSAREVAGGKEWPAYSFRDNVAKFVTFLAEASKKRQALDQRAEKASKTIKKASEVKGKKADKYSSSKRNDGTKGAKAYSTIEKASRKIKTGAINTAIKGVRTLGKGITYVNPHSTLAEKAVSALEGVGKEVVSREGIAEKGAKKVVKAVHDKKDAVETTKSTVKRDKEKLSNVTAKEIEKIKTGKYDRKGASRFTRSVTNRIRLAELTGRTALGKVGITISGVKAGVERLFGKKQKAVESHRAAYATSKDSVSTDSKIAQKVDKAAESVGKKKDEIVEGSKKVGRTISRGVTFAIGGAVKGVSAVGDRILSGAKAVKQETMDAVEAAQEGVRTATKYIAQAPERIENASRRGVSSLLAGMAKNTQELADKVYPKEETRGIEISQAKLAETGRV